ncbi:hypothetical protein EWB00_001988, partial [Schistosoma japonicum]
IKKLYTEAEENVEDYSGVVFLNIFFYNIEDVGEDGHVCEVELKRKLEQRRQKKRRMEKKMMWKRSKRRIIMMMMTKREDEKKQGKEEENEEARRREEVEIMLRRK